MTEHEDNRVHYLVEACEVRGHLDIKPDDLSLILIHQRELGKEDALAGLAEHDKEVIRKFAEEVLTKIDNTLKYDFDGETFGFPFNVVSYKYGLMDAKNIIEQMKEGGEKE